MNQGQQTQLEGSQGLIIRQLQERDLPTADQVFRIAFGTFMGLPEPETCFGDADYITTRWKADPRSTFAAEMDGEVVGTNFATNWGSVGFFGPLTIRPDLWDKGIGKLLLAPVMDLFDEWGVTHAGLFTFAHSAKHVGLYHKYGFYPRYLTAIMSKPVAEGSTASGWLKLSSVSPDKQGDLIAACKDLAGEIYPGLDVSREIRAVADQQLGDTVLLNSDDQLSGFAVCHTGPQTEAGSGACYVKVAAVRPGPNAEENFDRLLRACEDLTVSAGLSRLIAGMNTARSRAYERMLAGGFRTDFQGVAMERANNVGYNRPDVFLIDDWR